MDASEYSIRPFHTTPESRLERQPFTFSNGKVIAWDGRSTTGMSFFRSSPEISPITEPQHAGTRFSN